MTDPERLQAAVEEALEFLGRSGTQTAEREQLAKRVVDRGDAKVRKQLGDAIYDLARRCIQVHEKTRAGAVYGLREIATPSELKRTIGTYAARADVPAGEVAVADPSPDSSAPLKQAIDVLERLEGRTDSWKSLAAWEAMTRGDFESAFTLSADLAQTGEASIARLGGAQSAAKALIELGRLSDAAQQLLSVQKDHGDSDMLFYNLSYVHGLQGHVAEFERYASAFGNCPTRLATDSTWAQIMEAQVSELSTATGVSAERIWRLFGLERCDD